MNNLIALLIRQGLAACGGFFAANNITGNSTTSIVIGLIMLLIPTVWSWIAKVIHLEDNSRWGAIGNSEILRTLVGAIVSQGITALSVYFATDANDPELLGVAIANAAASKFGAHQKLAFIGAQDALKTLALCSSLFALCSCAALTDLVIKSAPLLEEGIIYGVRTGVQAGVKELQRRKLDAKQPRDVSPSSSGQEVKESSSCEEPRGPDAAPRCLQITATPLQHAPDDAQGEPALPGYGVMKQSGVLKPLSIPDYGARVADALRYPSPLRSLSNCAACHAGGSPSGNPVHCPAPALMAR